MAVFLDCTLVGVGRAAVQALDSLLQVLLVDVIVPALACLGEQVGIFLFNHIGVCHGVVVEQERDGVEIVIKSPETEQQAGICQNDSKLYSEVILARDKAQVLKRLCHINLHKNSASAQITSRMVSSRYPSSATTKFRALNKSLRIATKPFELNFNYQNLKILRQNNTYIQTASDRCSQDRPKADFPDPSHIVLSCNQFSSFKVHHAHARIQQLH